MELVSLIPGVLCIIAMVRWGTQVALQYVVLPVLLLLPTYYYWTFRPLPSINFVDAALVPLGAGMLLLDLPRWKFTRTDLWMLAFIFSSGYTDYHVGRTTDAAFSLFATITTGLIPYMAGKLLIEQTGSRTNLCKIFVWLLSISSFVSAYEYFMRRNPYNYFWNHFYPNQWSNWGTQIRWGFGRVAGPFSQSELAGMMVFTALLMALWLGHNNYYERRASISPQPLIRRGGIYVWILLVALFMTQARGPWIGAIIALAVASIGRAKSPLRRATIVIGCFLIIGVPGYLLGKDYLSGPRKNYGSEKETAQYRAELVSNYIPIAVQGGAWGWGMYFPRIGGQDSIDNEYLFSWIVQGYVGMAALILLMVETILSLLVQATRAKTARDRYFILTFLGIVAGMAFTISTVFLGAQSYELLFLLVGWSQALREPRMMLNGRRNDEMYKMINETSQTRVYS